MWLWLTGCVLVLGGVVSESVPRTPEWTFEGPVDALLVAVDSGELRVEGGSDSVRVEAMLYGSATELEVWLEGGTLYVGAVCPKYRMGPCVSDVIIHLPAEVDADVEAGTGSVDLDGLTGTLLVDVGSGEVVVESASVVAVEARSGTGQLDVAVEHAGDHLLLETGTGDVNLAVSPGAYDLRVSTGTGEVDIDAAMVDDPSAEVWIELSTGTGDIEVDAY